MSKDCLMRQLNAQELVNSMLPSQEPASPEKNLFLSTFTLDGENDVMKGQIKNLFIRPNFTLNISQLHFLQDVELSTPFPSEIVGFSFCLKGKSRFIIPHTDQKIDFSEGSSTLYKTLPHNGIAQFESGTSYTSVAIHLEVATFKEIVGDSLDHLPEELIVAVNSPKGHKVYDFPYSVKARLLLDELVRDEYTGLSKQFFVESKVLELIGLQVEALKAEKPTSSNLRTEEITKIRACESILREHFNDPLSLLQLSREVGLNDFKLKQGFKQVFGKPVFKYLQEYRLDKAMESLKTGNKTVTEVAEEIGYSSLGSFSNAFLGQFGKRPAEIKSR